MKPGSRCVRSRNTCGLAVRTISVTMARATTSRGASLIGNSASKRSPELRRTAPSPRRASEMRKRGSVHQVKRGGMELDEFQVLDFGSGAVGHGDAIAGGHFGIGGVAVDLAEAAGGQQHGTRLDRFVVEKGARDSTLVQQEVGNRGVTAERDVGERRGFAVKSAGNLAAGGIAVGVQNAVPAVSRLARESQAGAAAVELRRPTR